MISSVKFVIVFVMGARIPSPDTDMVPIDPVDVWAHPADGALCIHWAVTLTMWDLSLIIIVCSRHSLVSSGRSTERLRVGGAKEGGRQF